MAVYDNIQKTTSAGLRPSVLEEFIERTLLENMKPAMVHSMDAQKRTLPLNNGKRVKFRKFDPMPAITAPLAEGVTPEGQNLNMTSFTAMVKPYGGYVTMTDELNLYQIDNISKEAATLLSDQAALTLDTVARDQLNTGLNVQYVNNKTSRAALTTSDILNYNEIKKAVRTLKRNNVKPCGDGYYHAIVHPDVVHDLTSDTMWVDVAKYQDKAAVQQNELGTIYKVKFFESTNAKTFEAQTALFEGGNNIAAVTNLAVKNYVHETRTGDFSTTLTEDQARALTGKMGAVIVSDVAHPVCIERIDVPNKKVTLRWDDAALVTTAAGFTIAAYGGATSGDPVYSTLIYGADAFGSVELAGGGNVQVIVKEPGSSGSDDPLNQRGSIGWKVNGFTTVILQDDFIVRVESGASA